MEIIKRTNEHFNLAATYIMENGKVTKPYITFLPKGLLESSKSAEDLVDQVKLLKVEASSVEELEGELDRQEAFFTTSIEKHGANVVLSAMSLPNKKFEGVGV